MQTNTYRLLIGTRKSYIGYQTVPFPTTLSHHRLGYFAYCMPLNAFLARRYQLLPASEPRSTSDVQVSSVACCRHTYQRKEFAAQNCQRLLWYLNSRGKMSLLTTTRPRRLYIIFYHSSTDVRKRYLWSISESYVYANHASTTSALYRILEHVKQVFESVIGDLYRPVLLQFIIAA